MAPQDPEARVIVSSGERFEKTGYYALVHEDREATCFIPPQTYQMPFKRGDVAPRLISCNHEVRWRLLFAC